MNDVFIVGKLVTFPKKINIENKGIKVIGKVEVGHLKGVYTFDYEVWGHPANKFMSNATVGSVVSIKGELKEIDVFNDNNEWISKQTGILAKKIIVIH